MGLEVKQIRQDDGIAVSHKDKEHRISSSELLKGKTRLRIEHQGEEYLLQLTRQGKLILTK